MEIALDPEVPTYSGGLGVLAGDTIRSAADLKLPMVAISLLHRKGYFRQELDEVGGQTESEVQWNVEDFLEDIPTHTVVHLHDREVVLRAWRYQVRGITGHEVPVYLLDADLPENSDWDRRLTDSLYGGDDYYRLCQEVILGIGGVRMLRALGYDAIDVFHMNEGHAALLTLELLDMEAEHDERKQINSDDIEAVQKKCVFTTHTPVPAGHDQYPLDLVREVLGPRSYVFDMQDVFCVDVWSRVFQTGEEHTEFKEMVRRGLQLNMTYLALNLSSYVNGVAKKHGEVSALMFAGYTIDAITNGVHVGSWATQPMSELFDQYIPEWREDNFSLRYALSIPTSDIWDAHLRAKQDLVELVQQETGTILDPDALTLGFARRTATYKRADLLFTDLDRLRRLATDEGSLQIVYAGKAHPHDGPGKDLIRCIFEAKEALAPLIEVVYLPDYDLAKGKLITGGVDLWLNTPLPPNEASGTSGMKAALNGVPNFSVLDGWWIEGHIEGVTGWSIGADDDPQDHSDDARSLYDKLEHRIMPLFYGDRDRFIDVMRQAIALNGSFFNTQRMVQQYAVRAYLR
jgi:starch phosphorylase